MSFRATSSTSNLYNDALPNGASVVGTSSSVWSVLLWFKVTAAAGNFANFYSDGHSGDASELTIGPKNTGAISFFTRPGGAGSSMTILSSASYADNRWHWLFFVKRASNSYQAYIDGVSVGSNTTNITQAPLAGNAFLIIGGNNLAVGSLIGPVMNFKRALTLPEARQAAYGYSPHPPNLWIKNDGVLGIDYSGNRYNVPVLNSPGLSMETPIMFKRRVQTVAPPAAQELSGTIAGTSTAAGTLDKTVSLSGAVAGVGAAAGVLDKTVPISGQTDGTGAATGVLSVTKLVSGAVSAPATVTGSLNQTVSLSGAVAGTGQATGQVVKTVSLSGQVAGVGAAAGAVEKTVQLSGSTAGVGAAAGDLSVEAPTSDNLLSGSVAGTGAAAGSLQKTVFAAGSAAGVAGATGGVVIERQLGGAAAGVGTATGTLRVTLVGTEGLLSVSDRALTDLALSDSPEARLAVEDAAAYLLRIMDSQGQL
jgi:hypothetical protein